MTKVNLEVGSPEWHQMRDRACNDLFWLNAVVLGHADIFPMTYRAHYAMCRFAERKTGIPEIDEARIQLIQVWRGCGKSLNVTKGRTIQRLLQNRDYAIGIANEKGDNASAFLGMIKQEFETNSFLQALFPEVIPDFKSTIWRTDRIVVNRTRPNPVNPSVLATGARGTVTGVHMHEWIVDDLISQDAADNAKAGLFTEIERANDWVVRLQPLLNKPKHDPITFVCTPWFIGDTYHFIEKFFGHGDESTTYKWKLRLPDGYEQTILLERKGELAIFRHYPIDEEGRAVWPEGGLTLEALDSLRQQDPAFFAAQYLLNPSAGDATDFDESWLKEYQWVGRNQIQYRGRDGRLAHVRVSELEITMSVDPAISKKPGTARTALVVTGTNGRDIFLLHAQASRLSATETAQRMLELYDRWKPSVVLIEEVAYQAALKEVVALLMNQQGMQEQLPLRSVKTGTDLRKAARIKSLEPFFRKGMFHTSPRTSQEFLHEYRNFPQAKYKDLLDALSFQRDIWERYYASEEQSSMSSRWQQVTKSRSDALMNRYRRRRHA